MSPDGFIGAACALVGKILFDWLKGQKHDGGNSSGDKSPDYWSREIENIMERVLSRRNLMLRELIREALDEKFRSKGL